jgi:hypothetical protein
MKHLILFAIAALSLTACSVKQKTQEKPPLTISDFILQAEQLENTTVSVIGQVDHICMGSKAKIHFVCPEHPDENIKIFADENMKVFSDTLVGKTIIVTGKVEASTRIDNAYLDEWEAELEDEDTVGENEDHHHGEGAEEPETHHHGNQMALIAKYRRMVEASGKGYINLYKIIVSEVKPAEQFVKTNRLH